MKLFLFGILLLFCMGFMMINNKYHPSQAEQLVNSTLAKAAKIIKNKYKLNPCAEGAAMPGGPIQELTLCFETKDQLSKKQLRKLLILTAQELLNQVIENDEIQQFLAIKPFTIKNVEIIIFNHDKDGRGLIDPEISVARISQGQLIYRTNDPEDSFKYKSEYFETYEEALNALKSTHK